MTSTFHVFRKNQRIMIAVFGVLLMVAFTLSSVPNFLAEPTSAQNPLIATSRFGNIHAADVNEMVDKRNIVREFIYRISLQARLQEWLDQMQRQFGGDLQKLLGPEALQGIEARIGQQIEQQLMQTFGPPTERSVVETHLQAALADREGVVITDEGIVEYLRDQTGDRVTDQQMKDSLAQISTRGRQRITKAFLFDALRDELAAGKYRELFQLGMQATPAERWEYYTRMKRRATAELVAVPASDFISQIADPSQRDLQAFFDDHKEEEPIPGAPTPGFKVPHKAAFQYFKADYEKFYEEVAVTDKEIEEHYEKNKDTKYLYSSVDEGDDTPDETESPADAAKEPAAKQSGDAKQTGDVKQPSDTKQSGDTKEPAGKEPAAEKAPAVTTPTDSTPAASTPADTATPPAKKKKTKAPKEEPAKEGSSNDDQDDANGSSCDDAAAPTGETKEEAPTGDAKPATTETTPAAETSPPAATTTTPTTTPTTDEKPAAKTEETPGTPSLTAPGNAPTTTTTTTSATTTPSPDKKPVKAPPPLIDRYTLPSTIREGKNPKYAPLWKVREQIRKELAGARAVAKMDNVLQKLAEPLRQYSRQRDKVEFDKAQAGKAAPQAPTKPDFAELAKNAGVESGEIRLSPPYEVANRPGLGKSIVGGESFVMFAYGSLKVYFAVTSHDDDGNRYLFWKTEDVAAHVPQLAEVRSEVENAWKMIQARKPMHRKAEELAALARSSGKSLKEALSDKGYKVIDTDTFSWMNSSSAGDFNAGMMPRISEVDGVVDPGNDFMREIFGLRVGDIGIAENNPETAEYVVRVTSLEPSETVLRDTFMADKGGTAQQIQQVAILDQRRLIDAWRKRFMEETKLVWVEPPKDEMAGR